MTSETYDKIVEFAKTCWTDSWKLSKQFNLPVEQCTLAIEQMAKLPEVRFALHKGDNDLGVISVTLSDLPITGIQMYAEENKTFT